MKKGFVIIFALLILSSFASAQIVLNDLDRKVFNLGDRVSLSGYIYSEEPMIGFFQPKVVCENKAVNLLRIPMSFAAREQKPFSQEFTVAEEMADSCSIKTQLLNQSLSVVEEKSSKVFKVSKVLNGNFKPIPPKVQKGMVLHINGTITKIDGSLIDGSAAIYFKTPKEKYLIDSVQVANGLFGYSYLTTPSPAGSYAIGIFVRDIYGNEGNFEDVATFLLTDELDLSVNLDKSSVLPGASLNVFGEVKNMVGGLIESGTVIVSLEDDAYSAEVDDGRYDYKLKIPSTISSGSHTVQVSMKDDLGNSGKGFASFDVKPIFTSLSTNLNYGVVKPEDLLEITPVLLDQAGKPVATDVLVKIVSSERYEVYSSKVPNNEKIVFKVPRFAAPGEWSVKTEAGKLSDKKVFIVSPVEAVAVGLEGQIISINNIGNIKYRDDVEVVLSGEKEYSLEKKRNIKVNDSMDINLKEEVPSGEYQVTVKVGEDSKVFDNVAVFGGKPRKSLTGLYTFLGLLSIGILAAIGYYEKKGFRDRPIIIRRIGSPRKKADVEDSAKPIFGKATQEDVDDFKKRVVDDMKRMEDEERRQQNYSSWKRENNYEPKDKGSGGGLFNMFN